MNIIYISLLADSCKQIWIILFSVIPVHVNSYLYYLGRYYFFLLTSLNPSWLLPGGQSGAMDFHRLNLPLRSAFGTGSWIFRGLRTTYCTKLEFQNFGNLKTVTNPTTTPRLLEHLWETRMYRDPHVVLRKLPT